jgi:hypothetical protein
VWDWDRIGSDDFEGYTEFELKDVIPAPIVEFEVTHKLKAKKDATEKVSGTITIDLGFRGIYFYMWLLCLFFRIIHLNLTIQLIKINAIE